MCLRNQCEEGNGRGIKPQEQNEGPVIVDVAAAKLGGLRDGGN